MFRKVAGTIITRLLAAVLTLVIVVMNARYLGAEKVGIISLIILAVTGVLYARLRIDQLANLGWRVLAPLGLLQTLVTLWVG